VLYGRSERSTYSDDESITDFSSKTKNKKGTLDHFEKWIGVLKIDKKFASGGCFPVDIDGSTFNRGSVLNCDNAEGTFGIQLFAI